MLHIHYPYPYYRIMHSLFVVKFAKQHSTIDDFKSVTNNERNIPFLEFVSNKTECNNKIELKWQTKSTKMKLANQ